MNDFYASLMANLAKLGIEPKIWAVPYEAPSTTPFAKDHDNKSYDKEYIERFHQILIAVDDIFEETLFLRFAAEVRWLQKRL